MVIFFRRISLPLGLLLFTANVSGQHAGHGGYEQSDTTGIAAQTETRPRDDAVLGEAPQQLQIRFPDRVRLVKLTLHNEKRDWVDISFRYDPSPRDDFIWQLPPLQAATYYTADWAILGVNEELVRGSFSFAFGPGAEPPSVVQEAEAILLQHRQGESGVRNVPPPPTQIIINREPRRFDPPFTIDLSDEDPDR